MPRPEHLKLGLVPAPLQSLAADPSLLSATTHLPSLQTLAIQIQHNLQFQHSWSGLHLHTHSPLTNEPLPRPLLSGLPPERLYVHPDEQIELLKDADRARRAGKQTLDVKAAPEREWVLPTRLSEQWAPCKLADVFDAVTVVPPAPGGSDAAPGAPANPSRTTKRVVLATVDTDSTVVYYIVHGGCVKPRQN